LVIVQNDKRRTVQVLSLNFNLNLLLCRHCLVTVIKVQWYKWYALSCSGRHGA